jgi:O-acetyl-ADP-ribose deacetylase (regulator of RNase III)
MIKIVEGDIFNSPTNSIICHQVNCKGVMGNGIAKTIKNKYPSVYLQYKNFCIGIYKKYLLGMGYLTMDHKTGRIIANLFGQYSYGSGLQTDYKALESAFEDVRNFIDVHALPVAIPFGIGCGLAGGNWEIVYNIIEKVFGYDYDITIYKLIK